MRPCSIFTSVSLSWNLVFCLLFHAHAAAVCFSGAVALRHCRFDSFYLYFVRVDFIFSFQCACVMFVFVCMSPAPLPNSERPLHDSNTVAATFLSSSSITVSHLVITGVCCFVAGSMVTMLAVFVVRWCKQHHFRSGGRGHDRSGARASTQNFYSNSPAPSARSTPGFLVDYGTYSSIGMDGETVFMAMDKLTVSEATLKRNLMIKSTGSMTRTRLKHEDTDSSMLWVANW